MGTDFAEELEVFGGYRIGEDAESFRIEEAEENDGREVEERRVANERM